MWITRHCIPLDDFKRMDEKEIQSFNVMSVEDDADNGYFLEVDLKYFNDLHDLHSDYPLASEKMSISHEMFSPYQKQ